MAYTPPPGNALAFSLGPQYTAPAGDQLAFNFTQQDASAPLILAAAHIAALHEASGLAAVPVTGKTAPYTGFAFEVSASVGVAAVAHGGATLSFTSTGKGATTVYAAGEAALRLTVAASSALTVGISADVSIKNFTVAASGITKVSAAAAVTWAPNVSGAAIYRVGTQAAMTVGLSASALGCTTVSGTFGIVGQAPFQVAFPVLPITVAATTLNPVQSAGQATLRFTAEAQGLGAAAGAGNGNITALVSATAGTTVNVSAAIKYAPLVAGAGIIAVTGSADVAVSQFSCAAAGLCAAVGEMAGTTDMLLKPLMRAITGPNVAGDTPINKAFQCTTTAVVGRVAQTSPSLCAPISVSGHAETPETPAEVATGAGAALFSPQVTASGATQVVGALTVEIGADVSGLGGARVTGAAAMSLPVSSTGTATVPAGGEAHPRVPLGVVATGSTASAGKANAGVAWDVTAIGAAPPNGSANALLRLFSAGSGNAGRRAAGSAVVSLGAAGVGKIGRTGAGASTLRLSTSGSASHGPRLRVDGRLAPAVFAEGCHVRSIEGATDVRLPFVVIGNGAMRRKLRSHGTHVLTRQEAFYVAR